MEKIYILNMGKNETVKLYGVGCAVSDYFLTLHMTKKSVASKLKDIGFNIPKNDSNYELRIFFSNAVKNNKKIQDIMPNLKTGDKINVMFCTHHWTLSNGDGKDVSGTSAFCLKIENRNKGNDIVYVNEPSLSMFHKYEDLEFSEMEKIDFD